MIYFVTNKNNIYRTKINTKLFNDITILSEKQGKLLYYQLLGKQSILAIDTETNGLDAHVNDMLLFGIGNKHNQFMFDWTVDVSDIVEHFIKYKKIALGHNFKFDIKMIGTHTNQIITKVYDTMIAEQRLYMGSGYTFGYDKLIERYFKKVITKGVRNDFIGADTNTFLIEPVHLYYLKTDLIELFGIRKEQQKLIKLFKNEFLIYGIEFPFISILAKAELEGIDLDVDKWKDTVLNKKEELFNIQKELDNEILKLKEVKIIEGNEEIRYLLSGLKYNKERIINPLNDFINSDNTVNQNDLFGNKMSVQSFSKKKTLKVENVNVNYKSKKDIVFIFGALKEPLITPSETFSIPKLKNGKLIENVHTYTIKEDLLQRYLILKPHTIMRTFIELIIKQSKLEKSISTYGLNFIDKINPITNKIHSIFRQCDAATGRLQSGGGVKEPDKINIQNIPRDKAYRTAFTTDIENYSIITADYSGAELIVMASHAQDFKLIRLSEGDMHSHMGTICWRNIFKFRANSLVNLFNKSPLSKTTELIKLKTDYDEQSLSFEVTKDKPERTAFKPMTFGVIYGMYAKKAGKTLNIPTEEGKVVISTIEKEIPLTINMVKQASNFAEKYGFVIFDKRTNARAWFPNLIKQIKGQISKDTHFIEISEDLSAARNKRIQGTQATFVKEASVVMQKYIDKHELDIKILFWVHDEFVIKCPKHLDGKSDKFKEWSKTNNLPHPFIKNERIDSATNALVVIMEEVANRYLENVKIKVEHQVEDTWVK
jgi:DNA polymerase I-like protein with 3'-5' exonuclease and polymerase domains